MSYELAAGLHTEGGGKGGQHSNGEFQNLIPKLFLHFYSVEG